MQNGRWLLSLAPSSIPGAFQEPHRREMAHRCVTRVDRIFSARGCHEGVLHDRLSAVRSFVQLAHIRA